MFKFRIKSLSIAAILFAGIFTQGIVDAAEEKTDKLSLEGDVRLLYLNYHHAGDGFKSNSSYYKNLRVRVRTKYQFDQNTSACVGLSDNRFLNDHTLDTRAMVDCAYINGEYQNLGYTAGRFYHYGVDESVLEPYFLDGVKLRLGPWYKNVEAFTGNISCMDDSTERQRGYYIKAQQHWKKWSANTTYFQFDKDATDKSFNHQKVWSNSLTYRFDNKNSIRYERLNAYGQSYGMKNPDQSGYTLNYTWSNIDYTKPNTLFVSAVYYHQPQGSVFRASHASMAYPDYFDWSRDGGAAMGFKGPGIYIGYTLAPNTLLNLEAYDLENIYGPKNAYKQKTLAAYLIYFF